MPKTQLFVYGSLKSNGNNNTLKSSGNLLGEGADDGDILQDVFALMVNGYKFKGNCIDIGCQSPNRINNTMLLHLFKWNSINKSVQTNSK